MPSDAIKEAPESAKYDEEALKRVFAAYSEVIGKIAEASASLKQASEKIVAVNKAIQAADHLGGLNLTRKLRIKIVLGVVFPAHQHLDRLLARMKACASSKDDILSEVDRPRPAFE
jgi:hypothetical protein